MLDRIPGSYIKTTRLRLGWTQAAFAERVGITERVYQRREAVGMRRRQWELETDSWLTAELLIRAAVASTDASVELLPVSPQAVAIMETRDWLEQINRDVAQVMSPHYVDTDWVEKRNGVVAAYEASNPVTPAPVDTQPAQGEDAQFMSSDLLKQLDPK